MLPRSVSSALLCASSFPRSALRNDFVRLAHSTGLQTHSKSSEPVPSGSGKEERKLAWSAERRVSWGNSNSSEHASSSSRPGPSLTKGKHPLRFQQGSTADPYKTSAHVKELLLGGKFDDAVQLVGRLPKAALSVPVWSMLLHHAMGEGKYKVAHSIYLNMKRRGFRPTISVYTTLLQGWNTISARDWQKYPKQLEHCEAVYQAYREYVNDCKQRESKAIISVVPIAYYLKILGRTGQYQKMFDILYSLDESGPLAPDCSIYGAFFWALLDRRSTEKLGNLSIDEQNAADAKLLWRQLEKDMEKRGFELTWYAAVPILRLLARGRPSDHQLAIEIIRDYYGLAPPGETPPPPKAKLSWDSFQAVMEMCNKLQKFRLCTYYAKQVADHKILVLDHFHVHQVLLAYHSLAALSPGDESQKVVDLIRRMHVESALDQRNPKLLPSKLNYQLALTICWRCEDWSSACDVFTRMTGFDSNELLDEPAENGRIPQRMERSEGRNMPLDPLSAMYLARTAIASKSSVAMRQCLRMLALFDWWEWFKIKRETFDYHPYYQYGLAISMLKMIATVADEAASPVEKRLWEEMKNESKVVKKRGTPQHVPLLERSMSLKDSFSKVQRGIDFEMAARAS